MAKHKRLTDAYRVKGFIPSQIVKGIFGDAKARVITFTRVKKKQAVQYVVTPRPVFMIAKCDESGTSLVATPECIWILKSDESSVGGATW